ncbi:hypothetical protein JYU34_022542 [Plutella xylostella]|uniref:Uncharacterized protein n=1 Tax=Plutella xylostella TaxID=51655 RepID=A0ABQ7PTV8_PLUXY|nr:hypothetical protein JYU34_022542 [Plutella xylostella]
MCEGSMGLQGHATGCPATNGATGSAVAAGCPVTNDSGGSAGAAAATMNLWRARGGGKGRPRRVVGGAAGAMPAGAVGEGAAGAVTVVGAVVAPLALGLFNLRGDYFN